MLKWQIYLIMSASISQEVLCINGTSEELANES